VTAQGKTSIQAMCAFGGVSRASFYRDWEKQEPDAMETEIRDAVQKAALKHRCYGYRRIAFLVNREGVAVGQAVVRRILRDDNLLAVRRRKFVVTTDSGHGFTVYPNLAQYVVVNAMNQLWVADITYLRLGREFVFLAVVLDVYSRKVVGWALGRTLQACLPIAALRRAIESRNPGPGVVHHSDRGSQYASNDYVECAEKAKMTMSMSLPGRPWENGYCESFMNTLKNEQIDCRAFSTLEALEMGIEEFINEYYNKERLHSALAYMSPAEFETHQAAMATALSGTPVALSFPRHEEIYPDA
jgi:putative transposase